MNINKLHFLDFLLKLAIRFEHNETESIVLIPEKSVAFLFQENIFKTSQFFLQEKIHQYSIKKISLFIIFEFQWIDNQEIVKSRIESMFNNSTSIHGRKTKFSRIDKQQALLFLDQNHLQGYVTSKFKYGLFQKDKLVAVATFSAGRKMKNRQENFRSYELIRFANLKGFRIIGGLSKLIIGFIKSHNAGNIMTYADLAWYSGESYETIGFELKSKSEPIKLTFESNEIIFSYWNAGSLKYILEANK
jgi:hypothetical protein